MIIPIETLDQIALFEYTTKYIRRGVMSGEDELYSILTLHFKTKKAQRFHWFKGTVEVDFTPPPKQIISRHKVVIDDNQKRIYRICEEMRELLDQLSAYFSKQTEK